ncbi:MAG TPA: hypothetical protein VFT16_00545 [Candidatus Saccharimonadales bacterium]|nr:hypothetical protein [Candidatus Saccharimonadales bacterium]
MSRAPTKVPQLDNGTITVEQLAQNTSDRFNKNELLIYTVLAVVAVSVVGLVISTVTLYMDQARFNNQAYMNSTMRTEPEAERLQVKVDSLSRQVDELNGRLKETTNLLSQRSADDTKKQ